MDVLYTKALEVNIFFLKTTNKLQLMVLVKIES